MLHLADLGIAELFEMAEVEAEVVVADIGSLLLNMGSEHLAQHLVEEVGATVVVGDFLPALGIHHEGEFAFAVLRKLLGNMHREVVFLDGVQDGYLLAVGGNDVAGVPYFTSHLAVERSAVEDELEHLLVLLHHLAVLEQTGSRSGGLVIAGEMALALAEFGPVAELVGGGIAGTLLLLAELHLEAFEVYGVAVFGCDKLGKVDWEAVGVVEHEGVHSADYLGVGGLGHVLVHELDSAVQGAQEGIFLFADDGFYEFLLADELRVGFAHIADKLRHEAAQERLAEAEEGVTVAHCTAQDAADHIAGLVVARQLAVGNGKADGADVVRNHAHCNVGLRIGAVAVAGELSYLCEHAGEDVRIVVGVLALKHCAEALEAHSGVDVLCREALQVAVSHAHVLHENYIPYLYDVRVACVDELASAQPRRSLLFRGADVDMNLGTWAAWACVAHFPEVVVLVSKHDMVLRHMLEPGLFGFVVHLRAVFGGALEHCRVEQVLVYSVHLGEQFPRPVDGFGLEVVAEAPVAEHFEHGVVICVVADLLEVIVLSADAQALLTVGRPFVRGFAVAEEDVLELVHSGIGEHEGRVTLYDHRS